jgi:hypothetical protein
MELKKSKVKTQCVHDVNAKGLHHKNMTKNKQDHDKYTYSKLVLNKLKINVGFYLHLYSLGI